MFKLSFVIAFTFKMFCSFGPYCCVAPDMPWGVCVCVLPLFGLAGEQHHAMTVFTLS